MPQHQGQHRECAAAGGEPGRYRPGDRRGRVRQGHHLAHRRGDVRDRRHVHRARRRSGAVDRRPQGPEGGVRGARLGAGGPGALCARRGGPRYGARLPGDLSRARRRRSGDGARRQGGGAVGRRHRLAGVRRARRTGWPVHRARRRRGRANPRQARVSEATHRAGRLYPGQDRAIASVGSWSFILARPDLPDDTGYRLAKALHQGEKLLGAKLDQARETIAANTAAAAPAPAINPRGAPLYLRYSSVL